MNRLWLQILVTLAAVALSGCAQTPVGKPAGVSSPDDGEPTPTSSPVASTQTPTPTSSPTSPPPNPTDDPTAHAYYRTNVVVITETYWINGTGGASASNGSVTADTGPHCAMTSYELAPRPSFNLTYYMSGAPPQPPLVVVRDFDNQTWQPFPTTSESSGGVSRYVGDATQGQFTMTSPFNASRVLFTLTIDGANITVGNTTVGPGQLWWMDTSYTEDHSGTRWTITEQIRVRPQGEQDVHTHSNGSECA